MKLILVKNCEYPFGLKLFWPAFEMVTIDLSCGSVFLNCLHVDIGGKLVATFHRKGLGPANLQLKQTLVQHTFFPTLEGYVANSAPFI